MLSTLWKSVLIVMSFISLQAVGVLTSAVSDNSYSSEGTDACEPCPLKVSCVETVALPGRTRQILSNSGRCPSEFFSPAHSCDDDPYLHFVVSVCVRCDYHLVFFEVVRAQPTSNCQGYPISCPPLVTRDIYTLFHLLCRLMMTSLRMS